MRAAPAIISQYCSGFRPAAGTIFGGVPSSVLYIARPAVDQLPHRAAIPYSPLPWNTPLQQPTFGAQAYRLQLPSTAALAGDSPDITDFHMHTVCFRALCAFLLPALSPALDCKIGSQIRRFRDRLSRASARSARRRRLYDPVVHHALAVPAIALRHRLPSVPSVVPPPRLWRSAETHSLSPTLSPHASCSDRCWRTSSMRSTDLWPGGGYVWRLSLRPLASTAAAFSSACWRANISTARRRGPYARLTSSPVVACARRDATAGVPATAPWHRGHLRSGRNGAPGGTSMSDIVAVVVRTPVTCMAGVVVGFHVLVGDELSATAVAVLQLLLRGW